MNHDREDIRQRIAVACRVLGRLELTKAATGHVSARVGDSGRLLIRARGADELGVRYTSVDQVIECDMDGHAVGAAKGLASPQEVFIHTALYRARPEVQAVVHIHPPTVVLFTICDKPLLPLYGAYDPASTGMALDGIPVYPRAILINSPSLGSDLAAAMEDAPVCMMRGHGITTVGRSVEDAALNAIRLNELALMNYQANLLGGARPISEEDQTAFDEYRPSRSESDVTAAAARAAALWRYYVALTGS